MKPLRLLAALLAFPVAALAHHGWSEYDADKPLTLDGTANFSRSKNDYETSTRVSIRHARVKPGPATSTCVARPLLPVSRQAFSGGVAINGGPAG